tara:strand:+ start:223 stop:570 length:348 start_codon:yes stop_codon:yes gene_type:complete
MKSIILLLALLFSSSYSYSSQPTTKEFMDNIDSSKYDSYLYGLESGLDWANELTYREHKMEIFCKPNDFEVSASLLKNFIKQEIADNASFYKKYENEPLIGLAFRNSYMSNFSCQ